MSKNNIGKAAVIGAGVMGSAIAAHLANAGIPSLLLDFPGLAEAGFLLRRVIFKDRNRRF